MGGASIPCSLSERRWSDSEGALGVGVGDADVEVASPVSADSSAGVAAASDGLVTLQEGSQDMWRESVGKKNDQRMFVLLPKNFHGLLSNIKSPDGALMSASTRLPLPARSLLRVGERRGVREAHVPFFVSSRDASGAGREWTTSWRAWAGLCGAVAENRVLLRVLVRFLRKNRKCGVCARHGRLTRNWRPYLVSKILWGTRWRRRRRSTTRSLEVAYLEGRCVRVFRRLEGAKITGSSRFYVDRVLATLVLLSGFTTVDMSM